MAASKQFCCFSPSAESAVTGRAPPRDTVARGGVLAPLRAYASRRYPRWTAERKSQGGVPALKGELSGDSELWT